jgi:hypothetical protein
LPAEILFLLDEADRKKCPSGDRLIELGQVGYVPAAAEGFDQQHRSVHPVAENSSCGSFIGERRGLRSDNFEVTRDTRFVLIREYDYGLLRSLYGFILDSGFAFENPQRCEVVFDPLECR